eukprot:Lankesteria_metandrocarpae@DN992_c1_g1_i1.p1
MYQHFIQSQLLLPLSYKSNTTTGTHTIGTNNCTTGSRNTHKLILTTILTFTERALIRLMKIIDDAVAYRIFTTGTHTSTGMSCAMRGCICRLSQFVRELTDDTSTPRGRNAAALLTQMQTCECH